MTFLWFVLWLIFDLIGDREPLEFAPVNFWAGFLLLAVALDLGSLHAQKARRGSHGRHQHAHDHHHHEHDHEHPHEH